MVDGDWIREEPVILMQKGKIQNKSVITGVTDDEATIVLCVFSLFGLVIFLCTSEMYHVPVSFFADNLPGMHAKDRSFNMTKQFVIDKVIPRLVEEAGYRNPKEIEAALKFYYIDTSREESMQTMRHNYAQVKDDLKI